jgi:hypothetical protein
MFQEFLELRNFPPFPRRGRFFRDPRSTRGSQRSRFPLLIRPTTGVDIGVFIKAHTGENLNHSESFVYKHSLPRLCAEGTPDMRLCSICIPSICVNPYPPYAWKFRAIHNRIMNILRWAKANIDAGGEFTRHEIGGPRSGTARLGKRREEFRAAFWGNAKSHSARASLDGCAGRGPDLSQFKVAISTNDSIHKR